MRKFLIFFITLGLATQLPAQQTSIRSGSGGGASSGSVATGCTPSTLAWIDASGLLKCGVQTTASANTGVDIGGLDRFGWSAANSKGVLEVDPITDTGSVVVKATGGGNAQRIIFQAKDPVSSASASFTGGSQWSFIGDICSGGASGNGIGQIACITSINGSLFGFPSGHWLQNTNSEGMLNANYTNATTTFSNTNLSRTVPSSGTNLTFDLNLFYSQSTAVDGWKIDFNGGTAAATNFVVNCYATAETGIIVVLANATSAALATVINATTTVTTGGQMIRCSGSFVPSGTGTFIVRAGLNSTTTGTLTIKRGSFLILRNTTIL